MEKASLTILEERQLEEDYYIESVQNPDERSMKDFWLCRSNSGRKLFLGSGEDSTLCRKRIHSLAKEKIAQFA